MKGLCALKVNSRTKLENPQNIINFRSITCSYDDIQYLYRTETCDLLKVLTETFSELVWLRYFKLTFFSNVGRVLSSVS